MINEMKTTLMSLFRLRKKTVNGIYDDLPFLNLAQYGDIDNPDWIQLNREYEIPVDETEEAFQVGQQQIRLVQ